MSADESIEKTTSAQRVNQYSFENYHFSGISEGSVSTAFIVPQFRLSFDAGPVDSRLVDIPLFLLTHGHLDHSAGLPYFISQRALRHLPAPRIFCPPEMAAPLARIMELYAEIEQFASPFHLQGVDYDTLYPLRGNYFFQGIRSMHRIPSNGYVIVEKSTKLKAEFLDLPGPEIARRKKAGEELFYEKAQPVITFSGDTCIEFVLENETVRKSKILILECTYVLNDRPPERARRWGHIHLEEISRAAEAFRDIGRLYLMHFSPRYRPNTIRRAIKETLPGWLAEKTVPCLH